MFVRFMPILLLSNLVTSLAMAAQVSSQPDDNCILVQHHPSLSHGDIASQLGCKLSVRPGTIKRYKASFLIEAPDRVKEFLLDVQVLDVLIVDRHVAVNFVSHEYKVYALVNLAQFTSKNNKDSFEDRFGDRIKVEEDLYDRVTDLKHPNPKAPQVDNSEEAVRKRIENALAEVLKIQTECLEIKVTWEANWLKVPFPEIKYVTGALAQSPLIIITRSAQDIRLMLRPMPQENIWIKPVVSSANSHLSVPKSSTPPDVTFSSSSSANFAQQGAPKSAPITVLVHKKCTLSEVYKLVGLELPQLPSAVLETVIEGQISIPIDALKKRKLLQEGSATIPDQAGFSEKRMVVFLDE